MKRCLFLFIAAAIIFGLFSSCSIVKTKPEPPIEPQNDVYILTSLERLEETKKPSVTGKTELQISLAKNEKEGAQLSLFSSKTVYEGLRVSVSEVKKTDGTVFPSENIELYREYFSDSNIAEWDMPADMRSLANALIPMKYEDLNHTNTQEGKNTAYYIKAKTTDTTPSGQYSGTITLSHSAGDIKIPLNIEVWDFALPKSPHLSSDFLYWRNWADAFYGDTTTADENYEMHQQAIEIFADNRISITDGSRTEVYYTAGNELEYAKSVKDYMEKNPAVTCFPGILIFKSDYEIDVEKSLALINAYRETGIIDKIFYYIVDEPCTEEHVLKVEAIGEFMRTYAKDMWHYCTTFPDSNSYYGRRIIDDVNLWCSIIRNCNPQIMNEFRETGSRFWGYSFPRYSPAQMSQVRAAGWTASKIGLLGIEEWCVNVCAKFTDSGWEILEDETYLSAPLVHGKKGDGIVNRNMPLISLSLEASRDCFEDYAYLYMIKEKITEKIDELGLPITADEAMQPYYDGVIRDVCEYPARLYGNMMSVRNRIGKELSDGVSFIMTNTLRPHEGGYNAYTVALYTDTETSISMASHTFSVETQSTYKKHSMYYIISNDYYDNVEFCIEKSATKSYIPHAFLKRKIDNYSRLIDFSDKEVYNKLKEANPNATFEIIKVNNLDTLKVTFNKAMKRGQFIIPADCLKTKQLSLYNYIRCNVNTVSDDKPHLNFTISSKSAQERFSGMYYCEKNQNLLLDTAISKISLAAIDGEKLNDIRLSVSSDLSSPVTLYISDIFVCDMPGGYSTVMRLSAQNTEY